MNEIEEYLLMIYLESEGFLDQYSYNKVIRGELRQYFSWEDFKKEELGRTIPEEFEFYISQSSYQKMREDKIVCTALDKKKDYYSTIKIKITVVEE